MRWTDPLGCSLVQLEVVTQFVLHTRPSAGLLVGLVVTCEGAPVGVRGGAVHWRTVCPQWCRPSPAARTPAADQPSPSGPMERSIGPVEQGTHLHRAMASLIDSRRTPQPFRHHACGSCPCSELALVPEHLLQDHPLMAINLFSHQHAVRHEPVGGLPHLLPHNVVVVKKKVLLKPRLVGLLVDPSIPLAISLWRLLTVVTPHPAGIIAIPAEQPDSLGATLTCVACPRPLDFLLEQGLRRCLRRPPALSPACGGAGSGDAAGAWLLEASTATDIMRRGSSLTHSDLQMRELPISGLHM